MTTIEQRKASFEAASKAAKEALSKLRALEADVRRQIANKETEVFANEVAVKTCDQLLKDQSEPERDEVVSDDGQSQD